MSEYFGKRVLVTGATGFIGQAVVRKLVGLGAHVIAVSRTPGGDDGNDFRALRGDLADRHDAERVFEESRPHLVFHLASQVLGSREMQYVATTLQANLVAAVNMLTYATEYGVERLVLAGSMEEPSDGECPAVPSSPYAAAKWAATGYARLFHALYQTPVVVARIFMVYGPGQKDLNKLVPYVVTSMLRGEQPRVSSGSRPVDWVFVDDIVDGLLDCGLVPGISGSSIDLGTGEATTVRDVVELVAELIDSEKGAEFGAISDRTLETVRVADTSAAQIRLGWRAQVGLREGLQRTIDWYR